jgi:hypothetical protein
VNSISQSLEEGSNPDFDLKAEVNNVRRTVQFVNKAAADRSIMSRCHVRAVG